MACPNTIGSCSERGLLIRFLNSGGQDNHRQIRQAQASANPAQGLQPIHVGHHEVQENQVRSLSGDALQRSLTPRTATVS